MNNRCVGENVGIAYSECVFVVLGIQRAMRMGRLISPSVALTGFTIFPTLRHKPHHFCEESYWTCNVRFDSLYNYD